MFSLKKTRHLINGHLYHLSTESLSVVNKVFTSDKTTGKSSRRSENMHVNVSANPTHMMILRFSCCTNHVRIENVKHTCGRRGIARLCISIHIYINAAGCASLCFSFFFKVRNMITTDLKCQIRPKQKVKALRKPMPVPHQKVWSPDFHEFLFVQMHLLYTSEKNRPSPGCCLRELASLKISSPVTPLSVCLSTVEVGCSRWSGHKCAC